ncbi:hypothetical protein BTVI_09338 [Pitangus sulphuratus]|nr:hypothetical protein BTVI_09338 [Pitangus sulphuratus]
MGSKQSKGVNPKTPLGCILKHWKELGGIPGGNLSKKTLLKYCIDWWLLYKLDDGEKWPPDGTLKYNTILQLMLFLRRMNKWDVVIYADLFSTLRNKPKWQKDCGINVAPQDPLILALERDQKNHKQEKRCCDACSIGQRCLNLKRDSDQESMINISEIQPFPPSIKEDTGDSRLESFFKKRETTPKGKEKGEGKEKEIPDVGEDKAEVSPPTPGKDDPKERTSHLYHTRAAERKAKEKEGGKAKDQTKHTITLLHQIMPIVGEQSRVKVPFTTSDLNNRREEAKCFRKNPERFELIAKNLDIDWEDIDFMLSELTETEKELVLKTGRTHAALLPGNAGDIFPVENPKWDPNDSIQYDLLVQYRKLIALGLRNAIPKAINWAALYDVRQEQDETPSDFLERLRAAMRQYTPLDPASEAEKQQLLALLMGQSNPDIRKKLQKLEHPADKDLEMLMNEAWKVYNNREKEEKKREDKKLAEAVVTAMKTHNSKHPGSNSRSNSKHNNKSQQGKSFIPRQKKIESDQYAYCFQKGHWKRECPKKNEKNEKLSVIAHQASD